MVELCNQGHELLRWFLVRLEAIVILAGYNPPEGTQINFDPINPDNVGLVLEAPELFRLGYGFSKEQDPHMGIDE